MKTGRQTSVLAEKMNLTSLRRSIDSARIKQLHVDLIPTDHATAILLNCLQIVFFPYGARAPQNRQEFEKVVAQMTATLADLERNIAAHRIFRQLTGRDVLAQYNANAIFYGFGSVRIRENIAIEMRGIDLLIRQASTPEDRDGFASIKSVAVKLASTVYQATATLENNFATLALALTEPEF